MASARKPMPKMVERTCACGCGRKFQARAADVKRGWGLYFSKSCKAVAQTKRIGASIQRERDYTGDFEHGHIFASGYDGHGQD